jgi:acetyl esterase/lipase
MNMPRRLALVIVLFTFVSAAAFAEEKKDDKNLPRITAISPLAIESSSKSTIRLRGFKLDSATEVKLVEPSLPKDACTITLKSKGKADGAKDDKTKDFGDTQVEIELSLKDLPAGTDTLKLAVVTPDGETPTRSLRIFTHGTLIAEKEPNGGLRTAQSISLADKPIFIRGTIGEEKDVDVFRIAGKAGQSLHAEIFAERYASLLDGSLTIYDARGRVLASNDDGPAGRDPAIDFKVPADGDYFVALIDAHDRGGATTHPYLLELRLGSPLVPVAVAAPSAPAKPATKPAALIIPDAVVFERGIEYSNPDDQHLQLDLARPKNGDGPFPAVVCIHGGGFRAGTREGYDKTCVALAERGYVAVTITYRLAPKYPFPAAVQDSKAAVRWLRANAAKYHIDPKRIGAFGGSAGGHLAQFLGVTAGVKEFEGEGNLDQSSAVACVVNFYGPSDFTKSYGRSVDAAEVLPLFFGGDLEHKRREHIIGSPLYWVTPDAAPTLCVHGTDDKFVAHEQAEWIVEKLKAATVEAELLTLQGAGHGFKGDDLKKAEAAMFQFFDKHLKPVK